jgi:hypothetical protein
MWTIKDLYNGQNLDFTGNKYNDPYGLVQRAGKKRSVNKSKKSRKMRKTRMSKMSKKTGKTKKAGKSRTMRKR